MKTLLIAAGIAGSVLAVALALFLQNEPPKKVIGYEGNDLPTDKWVDKLM